MSRSARLRPCSTSLPRSLYLFTRAVSKASLAAYDVCLIRAVADSIRLYRLPIQADVKPVAQQLRTVANLSPLSVGREDS